MLCWSTMRGHRTLHLPTVWLVCTSVRFAVRGNLPAQRARPDAKPPLEWGAPLGQLIDSSARVRVPLFSPLHSTTMPAYIVAFKTGDDVEASAVDDACAKVESSGGQ